MFDSILVNESLGGNSLEPLNKRLDIVSGEGLQETVSRLIFKVSVTLNHSGLLSYRWPSAPNIESFGYYFLD